jgi:hypothetical protein
MIYALKERLSEPSLFCGKKSLLALLMNWVQSIPRKMATSRALLSRRKSGKSVIMQRLYNILWNQNGSVIPFYLEIRESEQWLLDFADVYYRTLISQYLSFKTRTPLANQPWEMAKLIQMAKEINNLNVIENINAFQDYYQAERASAAFNFAIGTPSILAGLENVFFLVMIDEIQYMTKYIFHDKDCKVLAYRLPGAYHGLAESKVAPMLVSSSYMGWMDQMMREISVGGLLKRTSISPKLTDDEGLEAVYRYAKFNQIEVTEESAIVINRLTQSDPFYIASLLRSNWEQRDFSTPDGVIKTLDYEIKNREGELFGTWSEYIFSTIKAVNDEDAKKILLFLSKERHKECTRDEINECIEHQLSEDAFEEKLRLLEYGDLIRQGTNNFRYCGIPDDILDLIFRDLYQEEIDNEKPNIAGELKAKVAESTGIDGIRGLSVVSGMERSGFSYAGRGLQPRP